MLYNNLEKNPEWLKCALQGGEFLKKFGHDGNYNWYFSLTQDESLLLNLTIFFHILSLQWPSDS